MRIIGSTPRLREGGERVGLVIHLGKQRNNKQHLPLGVISDSFLITSADGFSSQSHLLTTLSPLKNFVFVTRTVIFRKDNFIERRISVWIYIICCKFWTNYPIFFKAMAVHRRHRLQHGYQINFWRLRNFANIRRKCILLRKNIRLYIENLSELHKPIDTFYLLETLSVVRAHYFPFIDNQAMNEVYTLLNRRMPLLAVLQKNSIWWFKFIFLKITEIAATTYK